MYVISPAPRNGSLIVNLLNWQSLREDLEKIGLVEEVPLRGLKLDHLDCERNQPTFISKQNHTKWVKSFFSFFMVVSLLNLRDLSRLEIP